MGLSGNLTTGEILEQMIHADKILGEEFEERYGKENKKKLQFGEWVLEFSFQAAQYVELRCNASCT